MPRPRPSRSVVITGLGLASGHGLGHRPLWEALEAGRSAIAPIDPARPPGFDPSGFACRLTSCIPGLDAKDHVPKSYRKAVKVMARDTEIAVACAALAVADAGWKTRFHDGHTPTYAGARVGCHIGAGLIATEVDELASAMATAATESGEFDGRAWGTVTEVAGARGGMNNLQPLWLLKYLPNMLACHVTIVHGAEGPSNTITCGEASGLLSIGESARVIERGAADASLAGGAESKVSPMGLMRWGLGSRLASCDTSDDPSTILRPFDHSSRGSLLGEGGGLLALEEAASAAARGATVYARIAGFGAAQAVPHGLPYVGSSGDGVPTALALGDAVSRAMADAGLGHEQIDAVIPLALGVPADDDAELAGLAAALGDTAERVPLVALTPLIGNCVAGHGALAVGVAALIAKVGRIPPGSVLRGQAEGPVKNILVCASSLGGQAAAMVISAA